MLQHQDDQADRLIWGRGGGGDGGAGEIYKGNFLKLKETIEIKQEMN